MLIAILAKTRTDHINWIVPVTAIKTFSMVVENTRSILHVLFQIRVSVFVYAFFFLSFLFIFHLIKSREKDLCVSVIRAIWFDCGVRSVIVGWRDVDDLTELDAGHMSTFKIQIIHHTRYAVVAVWRLLSQPGLSI